ncbi:MAG: HAD family phosphatase [Candidatus Omnitrophota bacterium]
MRVKAVIFDMDGVLIDSMKFHAKAWQDTFKPMGADISTYEVYAREGENWRKSTRDFLKMAGYKPTRPLVEKVFEERSRIFKDIFKPKVFKGVKSLLLMIKRSGFKIGLVTATPRQDVNRMLPSHIMKLFDAMVCGGDTKKGKPHPEPYLEMLKRLKIKAGEAIVVENAPYGITSCKLAGIRCVAVATSLPKKYLKEADIIVDSLADVKEYFCSRS